MEGRLREICEFLEEYDAVTTATFGWFCYEGLTRVLPQMMLEISDLIWQ